MILLKPTLWKFEDALFQLFYSICIITLILRFESLILLTLPIMVVSTDMGVAPLEIFYNGEPHRLAGWPNQVLCILVLEEVIFSCLLFDLNTVFFVI